MSDPTVEGSGANRTLGSELVMVTVSPAGSGAPRLSDVASCNPDPTVRSDMTRTGVGSTVTSTESACALGEVATRYAVHGTGALPPYWTVAVVLMRPAEIVTGPGA